MNFGNLKLIDEMKPHKFLIGFSGGVDSTVLSYLLNEYDIEFDLAIVDYGIREQSKEEVAYAKEMASKYGCKCFVAEAPKFNSNFEANARDFRYNYFKKIANANGHFGVVLGHHLNDKFEWTLMQMTKGCGLGTIGGFEAYEERDGLKIYRPLIEISKGAIYKFAHAVRLKYFEDETNKDTSIKRNSFRKIAEQIVRDNEEGLNKTYQYLLEEKALFLPNRLININDYFTIINAEELSHKQIIHNVDLYFKMKKNYVLSRGQRDELTKKGFCLNINGTEIFYDKIFDVVFLFDQIVDKNVVMPKKVKEDFRKRDVPVKMRKALYLYKSALVDAYYC